MPTRALGSRLGGGLDVKVPRQEPHLGSGRLGVSHQPLLEVRVRPRVCNQARPQRLLPQRVHVLQKRQNRPPMRWVTGTGTGLKCQKDPAVAFTPAEDEKIAGEGALLSG